MKKLPKSLTTVTPFSKLLALCLFLIFLCAGVIIGMSYQHDIDETMFLSSTFSSATPTPQMVSARVITNEDNGKIVHLLVGQHLVISLSTQLKWQIKLSNKTILIPSPTGVFYKNMPQGQFIAGRPGEVIISATGSAICKTNEPCPLFLAVFTTTVIVEK